MIVLLYLPNFPTSSILQSTVLGIMKQFTFSSDLQRMSVLVRSLPQTDPRRTDVFVKGSPEMISQLCLPDTMPDQFNQVLAKYAHCGYRVLALAHKVMSIPWHKMEKVNRYRFSLKLITYVCLLYIARVACRTWYGMRVSKQLRTYVYTYTSQKSRGGGKCPLPTPTSMQP